MPRRIQLVPFTLPLFWSIASTLAASALPGTDTTDATRLIRTHAAATLLCDGDCETWADLPTGADGLPLDFEIALRITNPTNLEVHTQGDLYVVGPLDVSGGVWIESAQLDLGPIEIPAIPPIVPGPRPGEPICGCIEVGSGAGGDIVLTAASGAVQPFSTSQTPLPDPTDGMFILVNVAGDVYVDASEVRLFSAILKAGGRVFVVDDAPIVFVPEPSAALLVGIGLAGLAGARRREARLESTIPASVLE